MSSMHKHINRCKELQLFWPLCLEDDMGKTVLKVFACCHLAKEGRVTLQLNQPQRSGGQLPMPDLEEGELLIGPPSRAGGGGGGGAAVMNSQFIMALDMAEYRQKCARYGVRTANRQRTSTNASPSAPR